MSQLYIAQNTPLMCTKGRRMVGVAVSSQSTVKLKNTAKLMATEEDRFKDNFICPEMMIAGAAVAVAITAAFISTGPFVLAAAAWAGSALIDDVLPICSLLCKGSQWTVTHPKVKAEGKKALLEKAAISCFLGGIVKFEILSSAEAQEAMAAADMAQDSYNDGLPNDNNFNGFERVDTTDQQKLNEMGLGNLVPDDFDKNQKDGFYASLYHNKAT